MTLTQYLDHGERRERERAGALGAPTFRSKLGRLTVTADGAAVGGEPVALQVDGGPRLAMSPDEARRLCRAVQAACQHLADRAKLRRSAEEEEAHA
jgi:hypothetical protein